MNVVFDYKLLEALDAVVREGGFERAAAALELTQSAVSQRIRLLEDRLGQVLVARTSPPHATDAGQSLLGHFQRVRRMEDDLLERLRPHSRVEPMRLAIGVNADTLATWFLEAVSPFLEAENVVLDLVVDDQERTHEYLRNGMVAGCVSARSDAMQGCRCSMLGRMDYFCVASPEFAATWFPRGLTADGVAAAPAVLFNRKDELHESFLASHLGSFPPSFPRYYVPSSESFVDLALRGHAYGMVPDLQAGDHLKSGDLVDLARGRSSSVTLYWHRWGLEAGVLDRLQQALLRGAKRRLKTT